MERESEKPSVQPSRKSVVGRDRGEREKDASTAQDIRRNDAERRRKQKRKMHSFRPSLLARVAADARRSVSQSHFRLACATRTKIWLAGGSANSDRSILSGIRRLDRAERRLGGAGLQVAEGRIRVAGEEKDGELRLGEYFRGNG